MRGNDVVHLQFFNERGRSRGPGYLDMRRLIKSPADPTLREHLIHAGDRMHISQLTWNPDSNLRRVRQATNLRAPNCTRLAGRKCVRRFKMIQAVRRVG